ncbi:hypothetical protein [Rhizobium sp. G21]|uniref:hypothetical protein n=1 Tax=Rhizobium sp. G21 TaxID=2758439 RepID=UPI0015FF8155|nr:hypothetical protein [Rhizobium sp. G21]MBB1249938.1 hypothetical protein [Rhizobium sp. G21]
MDANFIINAQDSAGFREGAKGTHTSRTIMLAELERVLRTGASDKALEAIVLHENLLEKNTTSGRALSLQRLRELYGLDNSVPMFRTLSHLWVRDQKSLPLLAILGALARDPLLRATARSIIDLPHPRTWCEMLFVALFPLWLEVD